MMALLDDSKPPKPNSKKSTAGSKDPSSRGKSPGDTSTTRELLATLESQRARLDELQSDRDTDRKEIADCKGKISELEKELKEARERAAIAASSEGSQAHKEHRAGFFKSWGFDA